MSGTPDSSVLIPALAAWHPHHRAARQALQDVGVVVAHVLFETYSVLTRLPAPHRIAAADAAVAVGSLPWKVLALPAELHAQVVRTSGQFGIDGGAVYDALIATTVRFHGSTLLTRDVRARRTYEQLGVSVRMIPGI